MSRQPPKLLHGVRLLALVLFYPDGVAERIGLSEGPGPGSNPGRDTDSSRSLRVCRIAQPSSKLQDEVQLLGGLLRQYVLGVCWIGMQPCEG